MERAFSYIENERYRREMGRSRYRAPIHAGAVCQLIHEGIAPLHEKYEVLLAFAAQRQDVARMETIARRVVDMQDALWLLEEKDAVWERKDFWRGNSDEFPGDDETIKTATTLFADFGQLLDDYRWNFLGWEDGAPPESPVETTDLDLWALVTLYRMEGEVLVPQIRYLMLPDGSIMTYRWLEQGHPFVGETFSPDRMPYHEAGCYRLDCMPVFHPEHALRMRNDFRDDVPFFIHRADGRYMMTPLAEAYQRDRDYDDLCPNVYLRLAPIEAFPKEETVLRAVAERLREDKAFFERCIRYFEENGTVTETQINDDLLQNG